MLSHLLKTSTQEAHHSIEQKVQLTLLINDKSTYLKLLKAFYGYYKNLEASFFPFEQELQNQFNINLKERLKINHLISDLKYFGTTAAEIASLKTCQKIPLVNSLYDLMGVLYVLEGSTMGGQIITRILQKNHLTDKEFNGGHFFRSYEENTMQMWADFKGTLDKMPPHKNQEILARAEETFSTMENWLISMVK